MIIILEYMTKKELGRRGFLKKLGLASAVVSGTSLASCSSDNKSTQKWSVEGTGGEPTGEMTYRTNPNTGDKVSLLGYGCMRWPMKKNEEGKDIVDQEKVNELVDYAIEHGVNFFDTAPVYLQGQSEAAMGIALKRHPRDKFFIATKMSNPRIPDFKRSVEMYRNSLKNLQVDYIDYYLLHSIGGGKGIETFKERSYYIFKERKPIVNFQDNIQKGVPFNTPSGKIEIFSKTLYDLGRPEDIPGTPRHIYCAEGPEDKLIEKYPLQLIAYHTKRRCHSQGDGTTILEELDPTALWINPEDAVARGISDGDTVEVFNDRGVMRIPAKVTTRIVKGVIAVSEGGWYKSSKDGADLGGSINVLTMSDKATPLANGNPQHTNLADVRHV